MSRTSPLPVKDVLVPIDFSEVSRSAVERAVDLAARSEGMLRFVHVAPPADVTQIPLGSASQAGHHAKLEQRLRALAASLGCEGRLESAQVVEGLYPAETLVRYTEQHDVDLIVLSTHSRHKFKRLLLGSVAETVTRMAPCAVILCPPGGGVPMEARSVVAAVDLSERGAVVIGAARRLGALRRTELEIVHVIPNGDPAFEGDAALAREAAKLREVLVSLSAEGEPGLQPEVHVLRGNAADEILAFSAKRQAEAIVVSRSSRTLMARTLLGSTVDRLIRQAPVAVLVV